MSSRGPVVVVLGQADHTLLTSLRTIGLSPIAEDGQVVIWGSPPLRAPDPAPKDRGTPGTPGNLLMTIRDAAEALGLGRSTVYELIGRGQLEVVHVGRSARVPADAMRTFVERLRDGDTLDRHCRAVG